MLIFRFCAYFLLGGGPFKLAVANQRGEFGIFRCWLVVELFVFISLIDKIKKTYLWNFAIPTQNFFKRYFSYFKHTLYLNSINKIFYWRWTVSFNTAYSPAKRFRNKYKAAIRQAEASVLILHALRKCRLSTRCFSPAKPCMRPDQKLFYCDKSEHCRGSEDDCI